MRAVAIIQAILVFDHSDVAPLEIEKDLAVSTANNTFFLVTAVLCRCGEGLVTFVAHFRHCQHK